MTDAERALIHEALRFAVWAAGEGIAPAEGEDARGPEDFLFDYSLETNDTDWETLPDRIIAAIEAQLAETMKELSLVRAERDRAQKACEQISARVSPAPEAQQEPVAWRWRTIDAETWVYDPSTEWLQAHGRNPNVVVEPLFTRPAEQAVTEAMVEAAAEILIGRVNAPEQEIYTATRDALKAAMEAQEPHEVVHIYEGDGGVVVRDIGNISTFGTLTPAVHAAFEAASAQKAAE